MIIDAHAHIVPSKHFDRLIDKGGKWTKETAERFAVTAQKKPYYDNIALRLEHMDRNGIDFQVVTPEQRWDCNIVPGGTATQLAYAMVLNDAMASIMEDSKGRLIAVHSLIGYNLSYFTVYEMTQSVQNRLSICFPFSTWRQTNVSLSFTPSIGKSLPRTNWKSSSVELHSTRVRISNRPVVVATHLASG